MKIGILTFHEVTNFGAFLQAYALSEIINSKGHEAYIIDLRLQKTKRNLIGKISFVINDLSFKTYRKKFMKETSSFQKFLSEKDLDFYIVGSDQVWNKNITKDNYLKYFFNFLNNDERRISYAASFGQANWMYNDEDTLEIKELLKSFEGISVREENAIELCKKELDLDVIKVLDPTLLLNDYSHLITKNVREDNNYITCFKFKRGNEFYDFVKQFKINYPAFKIREIRGMNPFKGTKIEPFPSIGDWLYYIKTAPVVITDSFHGVCFSIIFNKKFIVIPADLTKFNRIESLLKELNLLDRIFYSYKEILDDDRWKEEINYLEVNSRLDQLKTESLNFLSKWL